MSNVVLIHIGKCGGTYIAKNYNFPEIHLKRINFDSTKLYLIWIRNPLTRFVSAFNMSYDIINTNYDIPIDQLTLDNCLDPYRIAIKIRNGKAFSKRYEYLVNFFGSANRLAEGFYSDDIEIKNKAIELMNCGEEHIGKGLSFYLENGKFITDHKDNILMVGKMETMMEDTNRLNSLLNVNIMSENKIRENKSQSSKFLSELAISNLLRYYENTEYVTLKVLLDNGFIDESTFESYHVY